MLLKDQFREVWIPQACHEELRAEEELPGTRAVRDAQSNGWLQVRQVEDQPLVQVLLRDLDRGEAEAIALAVETNASQLLLDEREGRDAAKSLGLRVTGVLGVLLRARREGSLASLREAMAELQTEAGFYVRQDLFDALVREGGEK